MTQMTPEESLEKFGWNEGQLKIISQDDDAVKAKDMDGDGFVFDNTPQQRPATAEEKSKIKSKGQKLLESKQRSNAMKKKQKGGSGKKKPTDQEKEAEKEKKHAEKVKAQVSQIDDYTSKMQAELERLTALGESFKDESNLRKRLGQKIEQLKKKKERLLNDKQNVDAEDVLAEAASKAFGLCSECVAAKACKHPIQDDKGRFAGCKKGNGAQVDAPYKDTRKDWDARDAYDQLNKEIGLRKGRQTEDEIEGAKEYTTKSYTLINEALRKADGDMSKISDPYILSTVNDIDSAISKTVVKNNMIVHRGAERDKRVVVGATIKDHAFVSTSASESSAEKFAQYPQSTIYHIKVPAGTKASFVASKSDVPQEMEVLLPRGLTYRVVGISNRSPYRSDVDLEIVNGE